MLSEENRERKKQQLLEQCFDLFVKKGLENTSLNDLTAYCKTYKAALYNYFKSKDEIVLETAKMYMRTLDEMFDKEFINPKPTLKEALKRGFDVVCEQRNELRYIYQIISSPKYGEKSRSELSRIYSKYFEYSKTFAEFYNVDHSKFRPYFLLFVATIHDYCLWENNELVNEKLEYIYEKIDELA